MPSWKQEAGLQGFKELPGLDALLLELIDHLTDGQPAPQMSFNLVRSCCSPGIHKRFVDLASSAAEACHLRAL